MFDRPTLDRSKPPQPATSPVEDPTGLSGPSEPPAHEPDPFRQLFVRHSNHLDSNLARRVRSTVRQRLFTDDVR